MSFDLSSIKPTRTKSPERIVVHGEDKVGKSTFAACSDSPIFIPTEHGLDDIDAESFPLCREWSDVMSAVEALYTNKHEFRTVVLDTADWAESLAQASVVQAAGADSIVSKGLGYGEGYRRAADMFRELLDALNCLRLEKQMRVIMLCHTQVKKFDDPLSESYDRYELKLHAHVSRMLQEWADVIGFAQVAKATKQEDDGWNKKRTRAIDLDRRVLCLQNNVAYDAGNRYGLPAQIDLVWAEFEEQLNKAREQHA